MKLTTIALLCLTAAPSFAGHVPNGWRDTGCDEAANVEIIGKNGNVLYLNNPTCPNGQGGMDPVAADEPEVIVPDEDEEVAEEPGDETPVEEEVIAAK
jgi:hypothetical protein